MTNGTHEMLTECKTRFAEMPTKVEVGKMEDRIIRQLDVLHEGNIVLNSNLRQLGDRVYSIETRVYNIEATGDSVKRSEPIPQPKPIKMEKVPAEEIAKKSGKNIRVSISKKNGILITIGGVSLTALTVVVVELLPEIISLFKSFFGG